MSAPAEYIEHDAETQATLDDDVSSDDDKAELSAPEHNKASELFESLVPKKAKTAIDIDIMQTGSVQIICRIP